jgi:hypothetical protein
VVELAVQSLSGIARTNLAKSTEQDRKKSKKLGVSSQNKHRARSQSVGVPNQTLLNGWRRKIEERPS